MAADVAGEGAGAEQGGGASQPVGGDEIGVPGDGLVRALHDGDAAVGSGQRGFVGSGHTGHDAPFPLEVDDGRRGVPAVEDVGGLISAGPGEEHLHAGVSRGRQQPGSGLVGPAVQLHDRHRPAVRPEGQESLVGWVEKVWRARHGGANEWDEVPARHGGGGQQRAGAAVALGGGHVGGGHHGADFEISGGEHVRVDHQAVEAVEEPEGLRAHDENPAAPQELGGAGGERFPPEPGGLGDTRAEDPGRCPGPVGERNRGQGGGHGGDQGGVGIPLDGPAGQRDRPLGRMAEGRRMRSRRTGVERWLQLDERGRPGILLADEQDPLDQID